ncbi:hypothetical protein INT44_007058 [Umbelopsis vinacea]|uniref:Uncharacterized protein n=1 Tax=Umbelopsis vinacea TaxID=44442 RepID=A0A8H7PFS9_9FUNG|nr:hypothetical protein INT44_007058 [Umbelopsis vinacea]
MAQNKGLITRLISDRPGIRVPTASPTVRMPELTASYISAAPDHNNLSCAQQIEFGGRREVDLKTLTAQLLSLKAQVNDHLTNVLNATQTGNDRNITIGDDAEADNEEEEDLDEESGDPNGGLVKTTESNGRAKRPKTN